MNLESVPSIWWDEGWTLSVARNWVEIGHYGRLRSAEPYTPGLAAAPAVVAPIVLSFELLGVGVWQGRLPGVFFTIGALGLIYYLAGELYNRKIALGTVGALLFMAVGPTMHPILIGRQVLGEMPAMFYLLSGYCLFLFGMRKSVLLLPVASLLWGIAIKTKAQVLPFWMISLFIPALISGYKGWWRQAIYLASGIGLGWFLGNLVERVQTIILMRHMVFSAPMNGLLEVTAVVPNLGVRWATLQNVMAFGMPTLLGLGYAMWKTFQRYRKPEEQAPEIEVVKLALLSMAGGWMAWYLFLGMWWTRYLFPPIFIGGIFAAYFLCEITSGYNVKETFNLASGLIFRRRISYRTAGAFIGILLAGLTVPISILALVLSFMNQSGQTAMAATRYLEANGGADALIETYDSELIFLSDLRYHYPPDQISVELQRRHELDPNHPVNYDPLEADPDYLVVGPFSEKWELYDEVLKTGEFHLVHEVPNYKIYQRIRP